MTEVEFEISSDFGVVPFPGWSFDVYLIRNTQWKSIYLTLEAASGSDVIVF